MDSAVATPHAFGPFEAAAILVVLAALLGYANHRLIGLPHTIGLTVMGATASLLVVALDALTPGRGLGDALRGFILGIDFHATLIEGMLSFLLFAGALHVDLNALRRRRWSVAVLSTAGVLLSTVIVGFGLRTIALALDLDLPLAWCLVFGALISPTDPVAVLGILKRARVPPALEATVAGESLFNDGVGIVLFSILLTAAIGAEPFSLAHAAELFLLEAVGGVVLGLAVGGLAFCALRGIDEYNLETLITLAVVMGGYALAQRLHVSGPVAMAVAGLLIGSYGAKFAMSGVTRERLLGFWSLVDEVLNSVLFLLIGLEVVALAAQWNLIALGLAAIPLVLAARAASVGLPLSLLPPSPAVSRRAAFPILLWGGLRGGISIALALALPAGPIKDALLAATYCVVIFSVVIQGATVGLAARRMFPPEPG